MTRANRLLLAAASAALAAPTLAADPPVSTRNSFRVGDSGVLCTAQSRPADQRLTGMFDRSYAITCRDAASAVGSVIAVRRAVDLAGEPSLTRHGPLTCAAVTDERIDGIGTVRALACRDEASRLDYRRYAIDRGKTHYLAEGLAGYDPALRLALASVVTDRPQPGAVRVATTEVSDAAAFARIQAGSLDSAAARTEAYARNNGGHFAESAEFFESLAARRDDPGARGEALANQALQQSNLSNFAAADRLLAEAATYAGQKDFVLQRLLRNYRAINRLNQRQPGPAIAELDKAVAPVNSDAEEELRSGLINIPLSLDINRESQSYNQLAELGSGLRPAERAAVLDAQALELRGIASRLAGRPQDSLKALDQAASKLAEVREGKLASAGWLAAEIDIERALAMDSAGQKGGVAGAFDAAIARLALNYPDSPMLLSARARKAAWLARNGDSAGARALFGQVVEQSAAISDSGPALRDLLAPYFELLARDGTAAAAAQAFAASQALQRPGVAQTQAILARQMSEGSDEAAAMFRLAVARTRDIGRTESEITLLEEKPARTPQDEANLTAARTTLEQLRSEQVELQAKLSAYPRYKVLAPQTIALGDLQAALRDGEGYYKLMAVGERLYALYATKGGARIFRIAPTVGMVADQVSTIRRSIVHYDNGQAVTDPFDVDRARALYLALFGSMDGEVRGLKHLIFEPDGPMLQLPPYLLVASQPSVDAYKARIADPKADAFDMRGMDWLGRGREVSISVSPRSFLDVRAIAPSTAPQAYLGLGSNQPVAAKPVAAVAGDCDWPVQTWQAPISPAELVMAQGIFGADKSKLITGAAFSDTALLADNRLDNYRILHFATHGLVTAPRPDCPARPALVTSFGGPGSDGLLSFREIFDLKLNADVVILSACDTAGAATAGASREAGIMTGGNYALDGLVRAFIGAGARSVVASHWPVPDEYNATRRLISGIIEARPGEPLAQALSEAQRALMDDKDTSHPFYWAAFIILGDGAKPLVGASRVATR